MNSLYIPNDILNIILEYDGRIKYKNGKYVNVIHKNDKRYNMISPILHKKMLILNDIDLCGSKFYFEFSFDRDSRVGLCYDYGFNETNVFEICYYNNKKNKWKQIRTYI